MVGRHRASFSSSGALSSGLTLAGKPDPSLVLRGRAGRHHGRVPAARPGSLSAIAVQGAGRERAHPASPRRRDWHPQRPPDTRLGQNRGLRRHEGQRGCARRPGRGGNTGPGIRCPRGGKSLHFPSMEGGGVGGPWGREPRWAQPPVQGGHLGWRLCRVGGRSRGQFIPRRLGGVSWGRRPTSHHLCDMATQAVV